MCEKKRLQIVILSYNRINSLMRQINAFRRLGYIGHSEIDFVIQDNKSKDGTAGFIKELRDPAICFRGLDHNMGYGKSYVRAHELCSVDYLWIVGDDIPLIDADSFLGFISGFGYDLVYGVFGSSTLPIIPKNYFHNSFYKDFTVNELLDTVSDPISLFAGFVSNVIWSQRLIRDVITRYSHLLKNNALVSHSPQAYIMPLYLMNCEDSDALLKWRVRVYKENIVSGPINELLQSFGLSYDPIHIRSKNLLSKISGMLKPDFGVKILIPACIWVHVSLFIGDYYESSTFTKKYSKNHLYPMAYHFSVLYKLSNYRSVIVLLIASLRRCFSVDYQYCDCSRFDAIILIYRLIACQFKGYEIKNW
jgi:hypothetical protein